MTDEQKATNALMAIFPPNDYDDWLQLSIAAKAGGVSFEDWDKWCSMGSGYNQRENLVKWNSFNITGGVTVKTLFKRAIENGWKDEDNNYSVQHSKQAQQAPQSQQPRKEQPNGKKLEDEAVAKQAARKTIETAQAGADRGVKYFESRGIREITARQFNIGCIPGFSIDGKHKEDRIIIPYPGEDFYVARRESAGNMGDKYKYLYPPGIHKIIFNKPALYCGNEYVFITEGQIDAITLEDMGYSAIGSNDSELEQGIGEIKGKLTAKGFIIIPDNDKSLTGDYKAVKKLDILKGMGLTAIIYNVPPLFHDVNDYSIKDKAGAINWAWNGVLQCKSEIEKKLNEYLNKYSVAENIDSFRYYIEDSANYPGIKTGFQALDMELDGGLYPGLYIIGAISSLGKTTFIMQMVDQIAKNEDVDILVFSLEMSKYELMAKTVSREIALVTDTAMTTTRKTTIGILKGARYKNYTEEENKYIYNAEERYRDFGKKIFVFEGIGDIKAETIRKTTENHIKITGRTPIIIIDYLQIIAPIDIRATDKQNTDRAVLELKRLSRDISSPVIAISSFNRENYTAPASMASFKESGAVEYSSDVLLAMQIRGIDKIDMKDRPKYIEKIKGDYMRPIDLCILKNRNGKTGGRIWFDYWAIWNLFREVGKAKEEEETAKTESKKETDKQQTLSF